MTAPLYTYWNDQYIDAARVAADVAADVELAVGWKITAPNGTTRSGAYYWPMVNGDHDAPVVHRASAWDASNQSACPQRVGDGLCLIPQGVTIRAATSGGARFTECIGHVLVYPKALALGSSDKLRVPWCVAVDAFSPLEMIRLGGVSQHLSGANLSRAYLSGANLSRADLSGADLSGANLSRANLSGANLSGANLSGADLFGAHLFGAHLSGANHDKTTHWPANFTPPSVAK